MIQQCIICGKEFEAQLSYKKTCSRECSDENTRRCSRINYVPREKQNKTCAICGKIFATVYRNQVSCSDDCRRLYRNAYERRRRREREPLLPCTCPICGKQFEPNHRNQKYCSNSCRRRARVVTDARRYAAKHSPLLPPWREERKVLFPDFKPLPKPPPKIFIAAAEAEHRPPTTDELLDWIFDPNRKLSGVDSTQIML